MSQPVDFNNLRPPLTVDPISFADNTALFEKLVLKLAKGEELNESERSLLQTFQNNGANILPRGVEKLRNYLMLSGSETDTDGSDFDLNPFKTASSSEELAKKQKNFKQELLKFNQKMTDLFGNTYAESASGKAIQKMIEAISSSTDANKADEFRKAVIGELSERNLGKKDNNRSILDDLEAPELELLNLGAALKSADIEDIKEQGINTSLGPNASVKEWVEYLKQAKEELSDADEYMPEYLMRKLEKLEKLTEMDSDSVAEFIRLQGRKISDSGVQEQISSFNHMIDELQSKSASEIETLDIDQNLKTHLLAQKTILPVNTEPEDHPALVAASSYLSSDSKYNPKNSNLQTLEKLFNQANPNALQGKNLEEKKIYLKSFIDRLMKQEQTKNIGDDHYTKADPEIFFEDFQKQISFLERYAHSKFKNEKERAAIQEDLIRYARGEKPSDDLIRAFGGDPVKNQVPEVLKGLNYLSKGSGDPRTTVGILKAIFTLPYEENGVTKDVININDLVQKSTSFEDLAKKLRNTIAASKNGNQDLRIPHELLVSRSDKQIFHLGNLANLESSVITDDKGNKMPNHNYEIFDQLSFDPDSFEFDLANLEGSVGELKDKSPELYALLDLLTNGEQDGLTEEKAIANTLKIVLPQGNEGKVKLLNNGELLANLLAQGIKKIDSEYLSYTGYNEKTGRDFKTISDARESLVEFSNKNNLGLFVRDEMPNFYHENEYEQMLLDFAMSMKPMEDLLRSDKAFYKVPENLDLSYEYKPEPSGTTQTTTAYSSPSSDEMQLANLDSLMLQRQMNQFNLWMEMMFFDSPFSQENDQYRHGLGFGGDLGFGNTGSSRYTPFMFSPFTAASFDSIG